MLLLLGGNFGFGGGAGGCAFAIVGGLACVSPCGGHDFFRCGACTFVWKNNYITLRRMIPISPDMVLRIFISMSAC